MGSESSDIEETIRGVVEPIRETSGVEITGMDHQIIGDVAIIHIETTDENYDTSIVFEPDGDGGGDDDGV
ncbi:hypothetical protein GRS48_12565 [Halorubrum sp. JWXQ-INN 858]|uniref:hypothetical protein n=1 Tax=Halorubrum sp. JWXQ-INN 858 TaxID=2690782 RepID=UPI0013573D9A|nr:hypothetical protein [Halorubrum sp. JWXQ-INN 858]MWV65645.1 hypothetical protein [Halorubrum sp. JWXQ-INN 858]